MAAITARPISLVPDSLSPRESIDDCSPSIKFVGEERT